MCVLHDKKSSLCSVKNQGEGYLEKINGSPLTQVNIVLPDNSDSYFFVWLNTVLFYMAS